MCQVVQCKFLTLIQILNINVSITGSSDFYEKMFKKIPTTLKIGKKCIVKADTHDCEYELSSVVSLICNKGEPEFLLAFVKVWEEEINEHQWYVFNDFVVKKVPIEQVVDVKKWKMPCILQYTKVEMKDTVMNRPSFSRKQVAERLIHILNNQKLANNSDSKFVKANSQVIPFTFEDLKESLTFAIDSEFVALTLGDTEIESDGTVKIIRPQRMHLGRLSVIRSSSPVFTPIIDDYIYAEEPIADYLTAYSGLMPEDLNPIKSKRNLVSHKTAYKKLTYLVDMGCIFVGHGLKKDFRTINIIVPESQIKDTVDIYRLEGQRNISLRFLAWYVLNIDIQSEMHDSVVDAKIVIILPHLGTDVVQQIFRI
jgi:PAB-dependent poly(A)-specific ribonuclease subunit 2